MHKSFEGIVAISAVFKNRRYVLAFITAFLISLVIYSYLLESSSLNFGAPKIAFGLDAYALAVSLSISALLSLSVVLSAFSVLNGIAAGTKLGFGAVVASIAPASLCCTSVIPGMLAAFGASTPTIIGATGALQGPFAAYEPLFIAVSIALLLLSVFLSAKRITKCRMVNKNGKQ